MSASDTSLTVAAVDLGSNSFHMVIARTNGDDVDIVDRLREPVRLADGMSDKGELTAEAEERALECLRRFHQRLAGLPASQVRAVGTNTLRQARAATDFRAAAREALGYPIEVVSGEEEARLIYSGVAHDSAADGPRLVVDIGGGSTEVIVGEGFTPIRAHSFYMGCVNFSQRFFPKGVIERDAFRRAETAAAIELRPVERRLRDGWLSAAGASGTANAVADLLRNAGWTEGDITLPALKKLRKALCVAGSTSAIKLPGLNPDRAPVLPGGLAILIALFKRLHIPSMTGARGALREGVLYDLVGRIRHEDIRDFTIQRFVERYRVDAEHGERVARTARDLYAQLGVDDAADQEDAHHFLRWGALLHEVGLTVSHTGYHKHGAYIVANANMPGFSADDQALLAALIRGHRRKLNKVVFADVLASRRERAWRLAMILRLAVLLNRSRSRPPTPRLRVDGEDRWHLAFSSEWLAEHPLTQADIEAEVPRLASGGVLLEMRSD